MRLHWTLLGLVFGAALLVAGGPRAALADDAGNGAPAPIAVDAPAPVTAPVQPGTDVEARDYELREAESPEVQEFTGGDGGLVALVLVVGILILAYLFLKKEGRI
jgi:hypothetical protein